MSGDSSIEIVFRPSGGARVVRVLANYSEDSDDWNVVTWLNGEMYDACVTTDVFATANSLIDQALKGWKRVR